MSTRDGEAATLGSAPARLGALLFALAIGIPLFLWTNPYPAGVASYWLQYGGGVVVVSLLWAFAAPRSLDAMIRRGEAMIEAPRPILFALSVAGLGIALATVFSVRVFDRGPSTSDEIAQLWHARILLSGHWALPADANPEFFAIDNMIDRGAWYSHFPIGGPLLLAVGDSVGAAWLVNPLLFGVAIAALYVFARHAFGEATGRWAAILLALAVFPLLMAGTYMNHVPTLTMAVVALAALGAWDDATGRQRTVAAAVIGFTVGFMATLRPLDAVVAAMAIGGYQLSRMRRAPLQPADVAAQLVAGIIGVMPLLIANRITNGSPFRFGYDVLYGAANKLGFHADPYGSVHTLRHGLEYAMTMISELNMTLFAWPLPAVLLLLLLLVVMRRATRWDALLLAWFFVQVAAYIFYWGEGEFLGPRFLFTVTPMLIVLLVRGMGSLAQWHPRIARASVAAVVMCILVAWLIPSLKYGVWGLARNAHESRRSLRADLAGAVRAANAHRALVFLREPLSGRLARRLYGLGVPHAEAQRLISSSDGCSLLEAIRTAEAGPRAGATFQVLPYVAGPAEVRTSDPAIHVNSAQTLTPACTAELAEDRHLGLAAFGPALPLESIGPDGHLDGDVIYAADLGERNTQLRARFGDRAWYRLRLDEGADHKVVARLTPY